MRVEATVERQVGQLPRHFEGHLCHDGWLPFRCCMARLVRPHSDPTHTTLPLMHELLSPSMHAV